MKATGQDSSDNTSGKPRGTAWNRRRSYAYDIHGIVSVESPVHLPELERFQTEHLTNPDIRVAIGKPKHEGDGDSVAYQEVFGWWGFAISITRKPPTEVFVSRLVAFSPHVLYTNVVEPVLRWALVAKGYALIHAACVEKDGFAFLITARTDTGKTTTMLKILQQNSELGFMSDDLTVVSPHGDVMTYPKPLTISRHTLHAMPRNKLKLGQRVALIFQSRLHSRSGRKAGFTVARVGLPAATMNAVTQKAIPPPKYHVDALIPEVFLTKKAKLAELFIIERGGTGSRAVTHKEAMATLMENCEDAYGFPPYEAIAPFLQEANHVDLVELERAIIADAFEEIPASVHESDTLDWAERLPRYMDEAIDREVKEPEIVVGLADFEESMQTARNI